METPKIDGLIYDAEIVKCIPSKREKKDRRFQYCADWNDFSNMGIACVVAFDLVKKEPRVFSKGNLGDFQKLVLKRTEIIGFNSSEFDDKLLRANGINVTTTYDILSQARLAAQRAKPMLYREDRGGYSLNDLAKDNGLGTKLMKGSDAPKLWQMGMIGQVIDYCLHDVMVSYRLFNRRHKLNISAIDSIVTLKDPKSVEAELELARRNNW